MKTLPAAVLCLALLAARAPAQDTATDPKAGMLVTCGPDTVAVFEHTGSPDGRYALGWTLHPHAGKPPVDWSSYPRDDAGAWVSKYDFDEENTPGDYTLLNGVLDLRARQFFPFKSDLPYFPNRNHAGMEIAWSGEQHGSRFAVVNNDSRFATEELWLIETNATGVHVTDIAPAAYRITRPYLRQHAPRHAANLSVLFSAGAFAGGKLRLHFDAAVPKSVEDDGCNGTLTIALPTGKMLGISGP